MDLRSDLSKLLEGELKEQKLSQREVGFETSTRVNGDIPIVTAVDADISDWLGDCADVDTINKVMSTASFKIDMMVQFLRLLSTS